MKNRRLQIIYRTPKGKEIMETYAGEFFVLDGWNEDKYLLCYRSTYFGMRLDKEYHVIRPVYGDLKDIYGNDVPVFYEIEK